jgi:putative ABC transport system permease protein
MEMLLQDLRFAARSFLRSPRFTIPAVLALALGIGATAAIFSVVHGVMLRPLPYREPDRVVVVWEHNVKRGRPRNVIASANFVEWSARNHSFAHLGMAGPARLNLMLNGSPEEIAGMTASSEVFAALGVQPALGRGFTAAEDVEGHDSVMVLSDEFWRTRLGSRPDVLGMTLNTSGTPRTVVGVMPPGFTVVGQKADFLIPYGWTPERLRNAPGRGASFGIARLRDGVALAQASADMITIAAQLEKEAPQRDAGWSVTLIPVHEQMVDQIRPALRVLSGAVLMVLLIACVNVANLLLARSTVRQREFGIRTALGARRGRLVRQMLSESLLLSGAGGVLGLLVAFAFHRGLLALVGNRIPVPRLDQVHLDTTVVAFTGVLALATALIFGVVPAAVASSAAGESLREGGRHGRTPRARQMLTTLIVSEVALSLVLLTGAGLLIRSLTRLQNIDPGFRAHGLLTARVQLPSARYQDDRRSAHFFTDAVDRVSTLPGVRDAAAISFLPLAGLGIGTSFYPADQAAPQPGQAPVTDVRPVTPSFFRTMGIAQVSGRDFARSDQGDSPPVAVVSESLVRKHLGAGDPIGKRLHVSIGSPGGMTFEIVGVAEDVKLTSLEGEVRPVIYVPHTQLAIGMMTLVVRTEQDPMSLVKSVGAVVHGLDPEVPLADVRSMDDVVDATLARPRAVSVLLSAFALLALLLAAVGVYGVMAYSVSQRTREIGVRMALGATPESIFRLVLGEALRMVAVGVAAGVIAAVGLTRLLDSLLYQTDARDPWTFAATALLLVLIASLASWVPARRGTRVAPMDALRAE